MLSGLPLVSIDTREHLPRWNGADPLRLDGDELVPWLEQQGSVWVPRQRSEADFAVAIYECRAHPRRRVRHSKRRRGPARSTSAVEGAPAGTAGSCGFGDFDRDGDTDYARLAGRFAGAFELDRESERWRSYRTFSSFPHVEAFWNRAQWVDLDGDGRPDLVVSKDDCGPALFARRQGHPKHVCERRAQLYQSDLKFSGALFTL